MAANTVPIKIGTASARAEHAADLGKVYFLNGKGYRIVQMLGALAAAAGKILVTGITAGAPTWIVTTSTTAGDPTVAGVVPPSQKGSTGTTGLVAGDYFPLQVSGPCDVLTAAAVTNNALVGCSTTAGKCDDASVSAGIGAAGIALETGSGADEQMGCMLKGLI